jgi:hypothetical protein
LTHMFTPLNISVAFAAIAIFFLGAVLRDFPRTEGKLTITRKVWLRLAFIFAGAGIGLFCADFSWVAVI